MSKALDHPHPVDPERVAAARGLIMTADQASQIAQLLGVLAEPTRARVLDALDRVGELCVGDLALSLEVSEDTVSYALRWLRAGGLVTPRKQGRAVFYRLADGFPEPLLEHCLRALLDLSRHAPHD